MLGEPHQTSSVPEHRLQIDEIQRLKGFSDRCSIPSSVPLFVVGILFDCHSLRCVVRLQLRLLRHVRRERRLLLDCGDSQPVLESPGLVASRNLRGRLARSPYQNLGVVCFQLPNDVSGVTSTERSESAGTVENTGVISRGPTFSFPTFSGPTFRGPTLRGPTF